MRETDKKYAVCGIEVFRCQSDGRLMTEDLCRLGWCAGHRLAQPARPTLPELLMLKLGRKTFNAYYSTKWSLIAWLSK